MIVQSFRITSVNFRASYLQSSSWFCNTGDKPLILCLSSSRLWNLYPALLVFTCHRMLTYGKRVWNLTKNLDYPDRTYGARASKLGVDKRTANSWRFCHWRTRVHIEIKRIVSFYYRIVLSRHLNPLYTTNSVLVSVRVMDWHSLAVTSTLVFRMCPV